MQRRSVQNKIHDAWAKIKRLLKGEPEPESGSPDDPYAYVGAPKKPRLPQRSAAAAEPLD